MPKTLIKIGFSILVLALVVIIFYVLKNPLKSNPISQIQEHIVGETNPLSIEYMRDQVYPGSDFKIEQELEPGSNYKRYIASYLSEGLKINGLLTVPTSQKPKGGYPTIVFNHGYIPPEEYQTTERYVSYQDGFASNGYVTFKSDYRGHGNSEGQPTGAYFSPAYTIDVLNALASLKRLPYVNKGKIGMWGHSMGGNITQRILVITPNDVKAAVIWGGVVGSYEDLQRDWWNTRQPPSFSPSSRERNANRPTRQLFIEQYGSPSAQSSFWNSVSPTSFLKYQTAPVQLHQGLSDETVAYQLSQDYYDHLKKAGKTVEVYFYPGTDHNLSQSFNLAMQRSVAFFDKYLK